MGNESNKPTYGMLLRPTEVHERHQQARHPAAASTTKSTNLPKVINLYSTWWQSQNRRTSEIERKSNITGMERHGFTGQGGSWDNDVVRHWSRRSGRRILGRRATLEKQLVNGTGSERWEQDGLMEIGWIWTLTHRGKRTWEIWRAGMRSERRWMKFFYFNLFLLF